jgi:hypothetical protein
MATINKPYNFVSGATIDAGEFNSTFDTIYSEFNGSIDNDNIKSGAGIEAAKINFATMSTVGATSPSKGSFTNIAFTSGTITVTNATVTQAYSGTGPAAKNTLYSNNIIKGWVSFNGSSGAINDSFNVTSVNRNGQGVYTVTWATTFANPNYSISGWAGGNSDHALVSGNITPNPAFVRITVTEAGAVLDATVVTLMAVGT